MRAQAYALTRSAAAVAPLSLRAAATPCNKLPRTGPPALPESYVTGASPAIWAGAYPCVC